ncbi:MAG: hypothetical protein A2268_00890 [Candidatus Raymondbacteria bacterium RifOxyA12_full_50_37]|uniref:Uncharacterized protein n=1 Tax=Candidatus Raymondbacteria bacterium RIFOXYD12_FULL_49_13 TaxID=1817890 RepID=A0A1F7FFK2_UNCRA|nr:MAG: hypothetical protein A2268_00890 [Candidatus Raymondbacteria bacterium RifOxyA12_full_50_37]OGJ86359.1 MAG: hypothetical protein A2248_13855 [Candidatus Raymondbacteria bacterium RIFOXYA2_FULL_49_16]OGJ95529.1 MAG: hypothetical protein A2453_12630 [Candidatus Raymondbacteria bacterium RIFOXYC2_FULL_50_21]OGJ96108.1 MAG: hypothetical protein A2487_01755 [Candidatus Raymondbacteria bacterium RifOxyC12_full_50_8]OGJ96260.1 MAG: hypothetical protein A2350_02340 [Candidatus Raymondbacteria b
MPEVKVSFSENVPSPDYKSKRFSVELSDQVPDPKSIPAAVQALFQIAKHEVTSQIAANNGKPASSTPAAPAPADHPASQRQLAAIFAIGKSLNLSREDVEKFSGVSLEQAKLNARDASKIIEHLKMRQKQAA